MEKQETVDLSAFDTATEQPFELQIYSPDGKALDFFVSVVGIDSDTYQTASRASERKIANRARRSGRNNSVSTEEILAGLEEVAITCTVAWRGSVKVDNASLPTCSADSVRKLFKRWPWLKEQVQAAQADRANFLPKAAND